MAASDLIAKCVYSGSNGPFRLLLLCKYQCHFSEANIKICQLKYIWWSVWHECVGVCMSMWQCVCTASLIEMAVRLRRPVLTERWVVNVVIHCFSHMWLYNCWGETLLSFTWVLILEPLCKYYKYRGGLIPRQWLTQANWIRVAAETAQSYIKSSCPEGGRSQLVTLHCLSSSHYHSPVIQKMSVNLTTQTKTFLRLSPMAACGQSLILWCSVNNA